MWSISVYLHSAQHYQLDSLIYRQEGAFLQISFLLLLTINFIISLDSIVHLYFLPFYRHLFLVSNFSHPSRYAQPSIAFQVTHLEVKIDPFIKSLQANYYYPLYYTMLEDTLMHDEEGTKTNEPTNGSPQGMPLTITNNGTGNTDKMKLIITVEDSLDVISELILEIKATDELEEDQTVGIIPSDPVTYSTQPRTEKLSFRFSLARKTRATPSSDGFLPLVKQFIHCILSTSSVHFLPNSDWQSSITTKNYIIS